MLLQSRAIVNSAGTSSGLRYLFQEHLYIDINAINDFNFTMTSITIRKLPEQTKERLRVQAARCGISLEAHARRLLQRAATDPGEVKQPDLGALASQIFGAQCGVDLELPPRGQSRDPIIFD